MGGFLAEFAWIVAFAFEAGALGTAEAEACPALNMPKLTTLSSLIWLSVFTREDFEDALADS